VRVIDWPNCGAGGQRARPARGLTVNPDPKRLATRLLAPITRRTFAAGLLGAAAAFGKARAGGTVPRSLPHRSTVVDLGVGAGNTGRAIWISDDGAIVGEQLRIANGSIDPARSRLVLWHDDVTVDLTALGITIPQWFDEQGDFIAWRGAEAVRIRVRTGEIVAAPDSIPRLRPPSGFVEAWPCARNADAVVGVLYPEPGGGAPRGFVARGNDIVLLDPAPGGDSSWVNDVNVGGVAVGGPAANRLGSFAGRAFRYDLAADLMTDLGVLPGYAGSVALGVNRGGDVVGFTHHVLDPTLPPTRACLWSAGANEAITLDDTLPLQSPWRLLSAFDLNDAGEIVGSGWPGATLLDHPYLLQPLPHSEPSAPRSSAHRTAVDGIATRLQHGAPSV
jgi:hypothetical protein